VAIDEPNPYASPIATPAARAVDPVLLAKVEAIIKDAGQFWLAILICIFCTGLGAIIIGPWYLIRLMQWNSLARSQPMLVDPNVHHGSIAHKFQSAKIKLIIGISFGTVIFLFVALVVLLAVSSAWLR